MIDGFRKIGELLDDKEVPLFTLEPTAKVRDAMELMVENNFSQIPVKSGGRTIGVISFRSISKLLLKHGFESRNLGETDVIIALEPPDFVDHYSSIHECGKALIRKDYVLIGDRMNTRGIATVSDAMQYFYRVSSPFILLGEIEQGIRQIILEVLNSDEKIKKAILNAIKPHSKDIGPIPSNRTCIFAALEKSPLDINEILECMTFHDYKMIITNGSNWERYFGSVLGRNRLLIELDLRNANKIRNDVFHFKVRELSIEDYKELATIRTRLLNVLDVLE